MGITEGASGRTEEKEFRWNVLRYLRNTQVWIPRDSWIHSLQVIRPGLETDVKNFQYEMGDKAIMRSSGVTAKVRREKGSKSRNLTFKEG